MDMRQRKGGGESLEDMNWLILPSMANRGITLIVQHEDRCRKEQTLAGMYKQKRGKRFVRALIPMMSLSRLQAETQLFGEGDYDTWCSFVRMLEAANAANQSPAISLGPKTRCTSTSTKAQLIC